MRKAFTIIILFALCMSVSGWQPADTVNRVSKDVYWERRQILPLSLITAGALLNAGNIKESVHSHVPLYYTSMDDYMQFAGAAQMYIADLFTNRHLNTVFDQTKYLFIASFTSGMIVGTLKEVTSITRPDGTPRAWPSGHTTQAFVSATILYREYHETMPLLAASGYLFAAATGIMRMTNNRHWLPDVVAGAGLGILVVNVVYLVKPFSQWQPFGRRDTKAKITAYVFGGRAGISVNW